VGLLGAAVTVDARDQEIAYLRGMLKEAAGEIDRLRRKSGREWAKAYWWKRCAKKLYQERARAEHDRPDYGIPCFCRDDRASALTRMEKARRQELLKRIVDSIGYVHPTPADIARVLACPERGKVYVARGRESGYSCLCGAGVSVGEAHP